MTRIPPIAIWLLASLVAVSLGASAGPVVWRLTGDTGQVAPPVGAPPPSDSPRRDLAPILAFAPFGASVIEAEVPQVAGETSLGLTLLGITIAVPAAGSRAIIGGGDGPPRGYFVGEIITGAASLAEIKADHVVLDVDGQLETLSFAKAGGAAPARAPGPDRSNLQVGDAAITPAPAVDNAPDAVIARYRAAIEADAAGLMSRLGLEITDQGYRITDSASPGVRQAGFRSGDVVTSVNGQKVGDMAADRRYFDEVAASGRARVELLRDGQSIVMSFPLR